MDQTAPAAATAAVGYAPQGSLLRLLLKNAVLTVVTLGIYRFWAKTRMRRYFWRAVTLDGEPFEYTGRGLELFVGFLIVMAVLVPLFAGYSVVQQTFMDDPAKLTALNVAYGLVMFPLIHVAKFRARRYRLTRTLWRGIRGGQDGSTWAYLRQALLWGLVGLATLGIAVPWGSTALQRYRTNATRFGDQAFRFEGGARPLVRRWLLAWAGMVLWPAAVGVGTVTGNPLVPIVGILIGVVLALAGYIAYRTKAFRHYAACTRMGEAGFESRAEGARVVLIGSTYFGGLLVLLVTAGVVAVIIVIGAGISVKPGAQFSPIVAVIPLAIFPVFYLGNYLLQVMVLQVGILKHLCATLAVTNAGALAAVAQAQAPAPRFGEGLADSFDIGV